MRHFHVACLVFYFSYHLQNQSYHLWNLTRQNLNQFFRFVVRCTVCIINLPQSNRNMTLQQFTKKYVVCRQTVQRFLFFQFFWGICWKGKTYQFWNQRITSWTTALYNTLYWNTEWSEATVTNNFYISGHQESRSLTSLHLLRRSLYRLWVNIAANCPISRIAELKLRARNFSMIVRILRVHMTACEQICQRLSNFDKCNCTQWSCFDHSRRSTCAWENSRVSLG